MSRLEQTTDRGETIGVKIYRDGKATLTVTQPGIGFVTCFVSEEQVAELAAFLTASKREPAFVAEPTEFHPGSPVTSYAGPYTLDFLGKDGGR